MLCEVAALSFQAHANYGTWSIDFGKMIERKRKRGNDRETFVAPLPL